MSPAPTYSIPAANTATQTEEPKIRTALSDLKTLLTDGLDDDNIATGGVGAGSLASNSVTTAKITSANVTDAKLASPNNSVYKTLLESEGTLQSGGVAASATVRWLNVQATASGSPVSSTLPVIYFDDADYVVGSLVQKLRIRVQVSQNTTVQAATFTFGLYPLTVAGSGTAEVIFSTAGPVASSTVAIAAAPASTVTSSATSDFTIPSDGLYTLGYTSTVATTTGTAYLTAQLQTRNV